MASYEVSIAKHATLAGAAPDLVRLSGAVSHVEVINRNSSVYLYVKVAQSAIVAGDATVEGDDTVVVPPLRVYTQRVTNGAGSTWVAVAGSSNAYSVQGVVE